MRKFGIELELVTPMGFGNPEGTTARLLTEAGVVGRTNSHFGRAYDVWQAKPDSSLSPAGRCVEVVSRILPAAEASYDEVHRVVTKLKDAGFGVNRTCGFHVHLNVSDMPLRTRLLVALRFAQIANEVDLMMPPSRRSNTYCRHMSSHEREAIARNIAAEAPVGDPVGDRYRTTNLKWINQSGDDARIEFRQAAGTCSPDKVIGWVRFLQEVVDEVVRRAAGVNFVTVRGRPAVAPVPEQVVTEIVRSAQPGRAPRARPGSQLDLVLRRLRSHHRVDVAWAGTQGIAPHVLRSIISGLRRHGAQLNSHGSGDSLEYRVAAMEARASAQHSVPLNDADIFRTQAERTVERRIPGVPGVQGLPERRGTDPNGFVTYPFFEGLSAATRAWVERRREDIAEAVANAA